MNGGLLKSASRLAIIATAVAAGGVAAQAADLGGNCCADLEERVAELEATTARKGNRKVKLTVSGQVNEALLFWDDGSETNAYIVSNNNSRTRFRFVGDAKINADWSAGYLLEIGVRYANSANRSQFTNAAGGDTNTFDIRHSAWWIDSKTFGRVWLGQTSTATDGITEINLANVQTHAWDGVVNWNNGFRLRRSGATGQAGLSALTWGNIAPQGVQPGEGDRNNVVKYVSPTFMGFSFQAAWGEDDMWDTALRYAGEFSGFRIAAGVGYKQQNDNAADAGADGMQCADLAPSVTESAVDCNSVGVSASIMHVPTGIYVSGAWGRLQDENRNALFNTAAGALSVEDEDDHWYVQAGIEQNWFGLGKTTVFGEYAQYESGAGMASGAIRGVLAGDQINPFGAAGSRIASSDIEMWGLGFNQAIDAAAMDLYVGYRNFSADVTLMNNLNVVQGKSRSIDDWQAVMMGGIIRF